MASVSIAMGARNRSPIRPWGEWRVRDVGCVLLLTVAALGTASAQGAPAPARDAGLVRGFVYDSIAQAPLPGAVVQVMLLGSDLDHAVRLTGRTDAEGRYEIAGVPEGSFMIGFFHPKLDSLGIEAPVRRGTRSQQASPAMNLAVPSATTIVGSACGRRAVRDSSGFLAGYILRPENGGARQNAQLLARWSEIIIGQRGARAATREVTAVSSPSGWFGLCGIPRGGLALLRVTAESDTGSFVEVKVPDHGVLLRTLYLGSQAISLAGRARLSGVVRTRYGEPVASARVSIWGSSHLATTNEEGEYVIGDVPPGSHTLEVRAMGFVPWRMAVDVFAQEPMHADVNMTDFATEIDAVRVLAKGPPLATSPESFEYRRRLGYGTFLDADEIERRAPQQLSDLLRSVPGVRIATSGVSVQILMAGSGSKDVCEPLLVLDGQRIPLHGMNINDLIPSHIVRAVEIYPRRMEAPPEFQTIECGTLVVWTGSRGWLGKRGKGAASKGKSGT